MLPSSFFFFSFFISRFSRHKCLQINLEKKVTYVWFRVFLQDMFSESSHILEKYESMCEGLVSWNNAAETFNRHLADSITNHLFANNRMNKTGLDLASLNLQVTSG